MNLHFPGSPEPTLGIEIELQTVDPLTGSLSSSAPALLARADDVMYVKKEVLQCVVEICTKVCRTPGEAERDLASRTARVIQIADEMGVGLLSAGTHPFSTWDQQEMSDDPRYFEQIERIQWAGRRLLTCGLHVHVGVKTPEKAIAISNALATFIPHLLALSASSPYWEGRDTGWCSARSKVFESLPGGGFPYRMTNWADFQRMMQVLIRSNTIRTINEIWWDIRPHLKFGTVEVRTCDAMSSMREIGAIAAFCQAMVVWMEREYDAGHVLPAPRFWILRENKWRAARFGLRANLVMNDQGYQCGMRADIERWVERLLPIAQELGGAEELERLYEILDTDTSVARQRAVFKRTGSLREVVRRLQQDLRTSVGLGAASATQSV